jgi:hypothetical protein
VEKFANSFLRSRGRKLTPVGEARQDRRKPCLARAHIAMEQADLWECGGKR